MFRLLSAPHFLLWFLGGCVCLCTHTQRTKSIRHTAWNDVSDLGISPEELVFFFFFSWPNEITARRAIPKSTIASSWYKEKEKEMVWVVKQLQSS